MLHEFLTANRTALITRCRTKVAKRFVPSETPRALDHGVPLFLQQLVETLGLQQRPSDPGPTPAVTEISRAAGIHGADLLRQGYSAEQVVREVWRCVPSRQRVSRRTGYAYLHRQVSDAQSVP